MGSAATPAADDGSKRVSVFAKLQIVGDTQLAEKIDRLDWYARFRQPRRLRGLLPGCDQ